MTKKIAVFFVILSLAPIASTAQTATTSTDGSTEPTYVRRERIQSWRDQSSELQQKINALPTTAVLNVPIPVLFGVGLKNIFPNFGDPRDGGTRTHEGEDIMAIKGTPIVTPTPAVVLRTGVGETEGNYIYTANPGGETFVYMHLDKIGEGVTSGTVLETGGLLGYVGNTGNASGGAAHLHFEIHTSDRVAIDPYPRLTKEFTVEEKIIYLSKILTQVSDPAQLSTFLVQNFRSVFVGAISKGIVLPLPINVALNSVVQTGGSLPPGDLTLGSSGTLVVNLQKYLILKNAGAEAKKLAEVGATGYFGPLTQAALAEYQTAMRIFPADGYYGPATRASVLAGGGVVPVSGTLTRDLKRGMTGEDVRTLQKFLNSHGYPVALSGAGSVGNETTYFGAATEAAVIRFQIANKISPSVGYVGPITRALIATL